jgi:hypothetical protein
MISNNHQRLRLLIEAPMVLEEQRRAQEAVTCRQSQKLLGDA